MFKYSSSLNEKNCFGKDYQMYSIKTEDEWPENKSLPKTVFRLPAM